MKIFSAPQIRQWDQYTMDRDLIPSIDLMERAALAFVHTLKSLTTEKSFFILCGSGNNGGDGLAIARLLSTQGAAVEVLLIHQGQLSPDTTINYGRLTSLNVKVNVIRTTDEFNEIEWIRYLKEYAVFIDAMLGTGLNRTAEGLYAHLIYKLHLSQKEIISVDLPSGLYTDQEPESSAVIVRAKYTITFQQPKRSFFYSSSQEYTGEWHVADIGLSSEYLANTFSPVHYTLFEDVKSMYKPRNLFAHKGDHGKALLMAGSYGMMGAAVLATKACLRSGVGLLKVYAPRCGYEILQETVPEAIVFTDPLQEEFSEVPDLSIHDAIGIGPGWKENEQALSILQSVLEQANKPLVIDAGALNLLSRNKNLWHKIPKGSILTPHVKEFERLAGEKLTQTEREQLASQWAGEYGILFVLKGKYSAVALDDGTIHYNSTGNPGMAKAGNGDCLTGILLALLAQGYKPQQAAVMGTFMHGYAGDKAAFIHGQEAMLPSDLIECLGEFYKSCKFS